VYLVIARLIYHFQHLDSATSAGCKLCGMQLGIMPRKGAAKYFDRAHTKWNIRDFLDNCALSSFDKATECYVSSLETIANTENGRRAKKAQDLLNRYKKVSLKCRYQFDGVAHGSSRSSVIQGFEPSRVQVSI
jgi:hypothetical protein